MSVVVFVVVIVCVRACVYICVASIGFVSAIFKCFVVVLLLKALSNACREVMILQVFTSGSKKQRHEEKQISLG